MSPFLYSSETVFCLTMFLYLFVTLISVVCFAMSVSYKLKLLYILPEALIAVTSILLFSYFSDATRVRYNGENSGDFINSLCFVPTWSVILIGVIGLALSIVWLSFVIKKRLSSLTAMSVKEAITALPTGLCFYDETGRILLLNEQINHECKEITGESLYDGIAFWLNMCENKVMNEITVTPSDGSLIVERKDGRVSCYKRIVHNFNGKIVYELSSTDISREFMLKKEIEQKNENLRKMNLRLRKYGEIVTQLTRERETLATKVKVHSNLGSLILRTKKMLMQGEYGKELLISEWNDIMSLIFASDEKDDRFLEADKTASSVGVKIFYEGKCPPKSTPMEKVFANAVFESVVNTARHANGDELYVKMKESETDYSIFITNNGKQPTSEIKECGGLSSLRTMTENIGGQMTITVKERFTLSIVLPKETRK